MGWSWAGFAMDLGPSDNRGAAEEGSVWGRPKPFWGDLRSI